MPDQHEPLDPGVRDFLIQQMYWQTCDPKNPDCLLEQVNQLRTNHKIVLAVATFIGTVLAVIANVFNIMPHAGGSLK